MVLQCRGSTLCRNSGIQIHCVEIKWNSYHRVDAIEILPSNECESHFRIWSFYRYQWTIYSSNNSSQTYGQELIINFTHFPSMLRYTSTLKEKKISMLHLNHVHVPPSLANISAFSATSIGDVGNLRKSSFLSARALVTFFMALHMLDLDSFRSLSCDNSGWLIPEMLQRTNPCRKVYYANFKSDP